MCPWGCHPARNALARGPFTALQFQSVRDGTYGGSVERQATEVQPRVRRQSSDSRRQHHCCRGGDLRTKNSGSANTHGPELV